MKMRLLLLLIVLTPSLVMAQRWKRERYEWMASAGASQFLGDLGGRNQIGSDYFFDLDAASTRYVVNVGMRYKLSEYFAARTHLAFGEVYGDDEYTQEPWRNNRNLHFRSPVFEWSVTLEGSFMRESIGSRYKIRRVRGRGKKGSQVYFYGFAGVDSCSWIRTLSLKVHGIVYVHCAPRDRTLFPVVNNIHIGSSLSHSA